jgi:uncharacterized membrane protein
MATVVFGLSLVLVYYTAVAVSPIVANGIKQTTDFALSLLSAYGLYWGCFLAFVQFDVQ